MRVAVAETTQPRPPQPLLAPVGSFAARNASEFEACDDVFERAAPRHQPLGLKQISGATIEAGKSFTEHGDGPRRWLEQPSGDVEKGRLATPGWPNNREALAAAHLQRPVP